MIEDGNGGDPEPRKQLLPGHPITRSVIGKRRHGRPCAGPPWPPVLRHRGREGVHNFLAFSPVTVYLSSRCLEWLPQSALSLFPLRKIMLKMALFRSELASYREGAECHPQAYPYRTPTCKYELRRLTNSCFLEEKGRVRFEMRLSPHRSHLPHRRPDL